MKQSLQLRIGQNLTMTPQLQQAIKLLQLSTLDLQQEIQQALDSNMMLEVEEEGGATVNTPEKEVEVKEVSSEGSQSEIPDELPLDSNWEDVFENTAPQTSSPASEAIDFETLHSKAVTLHDHLTHQLELISISERDKFIAIAIIDSINFDGYLTESLIEIFEDLAKDLEELEIDEIQAVLHRIQNFDPIGVAALDLVDCLLIQLNALPDHVPYKNESIDFVKRHLDLLSNNDQARLIRRLGLTELQFKEIIALIRTLNPKPGSEIQSVTSEYVEPDVYVSKQNGQWHVNLNPEIAPKLRVNSLYSGMIKRADNSKENVSMKEHLQEARWFIKSLNSRNETLLRVAQCIVEKQLGFLEHGAIAMKPMVLRNIAEELELHESTISRVTNQKYMHTPNGVYEFKYFFSSHVSTESGGECSATAIRAFISELVENENPAKPLSDSKMSGLFKEKGINVARRTIAKYRESMSIPSSSQRKRLI